MNTKQKFSYMVVGGTFTLVGLLIGMIVSPITAQKDTFGEITCIGLTVVDENGIERVKLGKKEKGTRGSDQYGIVVRDKKNKYPIAMYSDDLLGAGVEIYDNNGKITIQNGRVVATRTKGSEGNLTTTIGGGWISIFGEYGSLIGNMLVMGANSDGGGYIILSGNGAVSSWDKNEYHRSNPK